MKRVLLADTAPARWPRLWRMILVMLGALILCSCRGPIQREYDASRLGAGFPTLPHAAIPAVVSEQADECDSPRPPIGPPGMEQGVPLPYQPAGPWAPPGIAKPWPQDEYLRDGGDRGNPAGVGVQEQLYGLGQGDAVARYDTLDGNTVVVPTNEVYLYSPRFGAVRQVVGLVANEQQNRAAGVFAPERLAIPKSVEKARSSKQNIQARGELGVRPPVTYLGQKWAGAMSSRLGPLGFDNRFKAYENLAAIRRGVIEEAEMAWLARGTTAAIAWTHNQAVQVILDRKIAVAEVSDQRLQSVYTVGTPEGHKLRVIKVASTPFAAPGEEVDFTIRFDNVGQQPIGNVAILDSLTTRLEYVANSAQCSREAQFSTQPNEAESLVVRCELTAPLEPGQGGVLRFRCRVR